MLIEFRAANHRSIREEQVLSMEAHGKFDDPADERPREVKNHAKPLLPVAALYGANASGKSNILSAFDFMRDAVLTSSRIWAPEEGVPRDPFVWGNIRNEPSLFEVHFVTEESRYRYGFVVDDQTVREEWLDAWPNSKKQRWFTRDEQRFTFGPRLQDVPKVIEEATRPNALFLSTAVQLSQQSLEPIYRWFRNMHGLFPVDASRGRRSTYRHHRHAAIQIIRDWTAGQSQMFDMEDGSKPLDGRQYVEFMRQADIGILDIRSIRDESRRERFRIELKHACDVDNAWLALEEESQGTQTLFDMTMPLLAAVENGSLVFVDELEASLHPKIAEAIVRQFNSPETNPRGAQLIFTTHDTNLLGNLDGDPPLRRDEVWLTEKDASGGTVLYPLTDLKPRKAENLERGYLQGRYGAIPFLNFDMTPQ